MDRFWNCLLLYLGGAVLIFFPLPFPGPLFAEHMDCSRYVGRHAQAAVVVAVVAVVEHWIAWTTVDYCCRPPSAGGAERRIRVARLRAVVM